MTVGSEGLRLQLATKVWIKSYRKLESVSEVKTFMKRAYPKSVEI